jgi:drug/metabolite transporter (DMT)-like permease
MASPLPPVPPLSSEAPNSTDTTPTPEPTAQQPQNVTLGLLMIVAALALFSLQDVMVKGLSGSYPVHEVVFIRSLIAVWPMIFLSWVLDGGRSMQLSRPFWQSVRSLIMVVSFTTYYLAFASLSLAQATVLFFTAPLFITLISWIFGKADVGWRRMASILVGLLGVVVMIRPDANIPLVPALFALTAAVSYATAQFMTSWLGKTESATSMSLTFMFANMVIGAIMLLAFGDGWALAYTPDSLTFLLRPWVWPTREHLYLLVAIGLFAVVGFLLLFQAYRLAPSHVAAPMEYSLLIYNMLWSYFYFGEVLDHWTLIGTTLIVGSGLFMLYRETARGEPLVRRLFKPRRLR